jgi:hypothetical protein
MDEYGYTDLDQDDDAFFDEDGSLNDEDLVELLQESSTHHEIDTGLDPADFEEEEDEEDYENL